MSKNAGKDLAKKSKEAKLPKPPGGKAKQHPFEQQKTGEYMATRLTARIDQCENDVPRLQEGVTALANHLRNRCGSSPFCQYHLDEQHADFKEEWKGGCYKPMFTDAQLYGETGEHKIQVDEVLNNWIERWASQGACEKMAGNMENNVCEATNAIVLMFLQKRIFARSEDRYDAAMFLAGGYHNVGSKIFKYFLEEYLGQTDLATQFVDMTKPVFDRLDRKREYNLAYKQQESAKARRRLNKKARTNQASTYDVTNDVDSTYHRSKVCWAR
jgi:hypothetical protein